MPDRTPHDPLWRELFLAEYASLRDESAHARQAQQAVLQWSLATSAVILGAAVAFFARGGPAPPTGAVFVFLLVYGFGMPAFAAAAFMAWFGELLRMERVGVFLRGRERLTWDDAALREEIRESVSGGEAWRQAMVWENWIAFGTGGLGARKQIVGYLGGVLLYVGLFVASELIFLNAALAHDFAAHDGAWRAAAWVWTILSSSAFVVLVATVGWQLKRQGTRAAGPLT